MTYFPSEIVTPAAHLPISATDEALAAAVTEEIERSVLVAGCSAPDKRRIIIDGPLTPRIELEPVSSSREPHTGGRLPMMQP